MTIALLLMPAFANASALSVLSSLVSEVIPSAQASSLQYNSQNVPLLASATNIDPHPAVGGGDITVVDNSALAAVDGPSGTALDTASIPASSEISVYTVRDGDTLSGIAQMFNVSVNTIVWANNIKNKVIHPGDTLIILPITGIQHVVVKGDTLASLAKTYKSDAHEIAQNNNLDDNAALTVGDTIIIPDGELGVSSSSSGSSGSKNNSRPKIRPGSEPYLGGSGPAITGYFAWPVDGGIITQGLHGWNAVDIGASRGTAIYAAADGTVIVAQNNAAWNGGYGNYVVISHPNGTETLYAHMSKVLVSGGEAVTQGQTIGLVGMTGLATGPHLHFEVRGATNPFASLDLGASE